VLQPEKDTQGQSVQSFVNVKQSTEYKAVHTFASPPLLSLFVEDCGGGSGEENGLLVGEVPSDVSVACGDRAAS